MKDEKEKLSNEKESVIDETDDLNIETEANMSKDSSLYYLGATVGDIENAILKDSNISECVVTVV